LKTTETNLDHERVVFTKHPDKTQGTTRVVQASIRRFGATDANGNDVAKKPKGYFFLCLFFLSLFFLL